MIGAWLLDGSEPALVDCGPASCVDALLRGLHAHAVDPAGLRHLLLTHIHPDHCGAGGGPCGDTHTCRSTSTSVALRT